MTVGGVPVDGQGRPIERAEYGALILHGIRWATVPAGEAGQAFLAGRKCQECREVVEEGQVVMWFDFADACDVFKGVAVFHFSCIEESLDHAPLVVTPDSLASAIAGLERILDET